jgi:hypothetical protein
MWQNMRCPILFYLQVPQWEMANRDGPRQFVGELLDLPSPQRGVLVHTNTALMQRQDVKKPRG